MISLVTIDYIIDGNIVYQYCPDPDAPVDLDHCYLDYPWQSIITHSTSLSVWYYTCLAFYFLAGLNNTVLAVELFRDRGRIPDRDGFFARPDYIGQNMGWS